MTVVFDFDGALALARHLYALADGLAEVLGSRRTQSEAALVGWQGAYGREFIVRANDEQSTGSQLVGILRGEADGWAEEWRKAMDQENWNRYAAAVNRVKSRRDLWDDISGFFTGHDDLPPTPRAADRPVAPGYGATRSFANYSHY